jgi:hypothetical protein
VVKLTAGGDPPPLAQLLKDTYKRFSKYQKAAKDIRMAVALVKTLRALLKRQSSPELLQDLSTIAGHFLKFNWPDDRLKVSPSSSSSFFYLFC